MRKLTTLNSQIPIARDSMIQFSFLLLPALLVSVHAITWRGADFSSLANLESSGRTYRDASGGAVTPFEDILHSHGANLARIRIWTSTSEDQYSLNYGLALGKRAAAAGMSLLVDLHYSDTCKCCFECCLNINTGWHRQGQIQATKPFRLPGHKISMA